MFIKNTQPADFTTYRKRKSANHIKYKSLSKGRGLVAIYEKINPGPKSVSTIYVRKTFDNQGTWPSRHRLSLAQDTDLCLGFLWELHALRLWNLKTPPTTIAVILNYPCWKQMITYFVCSRTILGVLFF